MRRAQGDVAWSAAVWVKSRIEAAIDEAAIHTAVQDSVQAAMYVAV
jgi:hypothetical protein